MTDPRTCAACNSTGYQPGPRGLPCPQCNPAAPGYARVGVVRPAPDPDAGADRLVKALIALTGARQRGENPDPHVQELARAWADAEGGSAYTRTLDVRTICGLTKREAA